jgi:hypothetical protein
MRTIGKACLERGCGALILCVKETEAQEWVRMAAKAGRSKDVFLINSACQYRTNVLDYHHRATERNTENVVDLLATLSSFTGGTKDAGGDGAEWREAAKMMFRNCIDLLYLAGHDVSFDELNKLRLSLPSSLEDVDDTDFMKSCYAHQLYQEAVERLRKLPRGANQHKDLATCKNYLFSEWPGYGDKQQGSIVMMVTTVIDAFSRGDLNNLFCQWGNSEGVWGNEKTGWKKGTLSLTPDLIFSHGAIVIIDISQKKYKAFGSVANALWKFLFQSAADRRTDLHLGDAARPAVLICDEHQEFFSETDTDFQGTSRSLKVFQLFATQNLDQYYRKIPNRAVVDALLGVLQLKFGHRNGHEGTNKYYCALIGEEWQMTGSSKSKNPAANGQKATSSTSSNMGYAAALKPEIFNTLASGGPIFNFQGGVIIHQVGRTFGTKNYARTTLNQVLI